MRTKIRGAGAPRDSRPSSVPDETRLIEICDSPIERALAALESGTGGIGAEEADRRLAKFGPNELSRMRRLGFLPDILGRLKSPLVIQLLVIAAISALVGERRSAAVVGAMILLSVGLSYFLDRRSSKEVEALGKRVQSRSSVLRDGRESEVRMSEIVPGDLVLLRAGSIVPADSRIVSSKDFFVSESALTGESMPVEKGERPAPDGAKAALELPNACFMGTSVVSGTAKALVVNTGGRTLFGALSATIVGSRAETSFDKGIRSFTWLMIRIMIVLVAAVFLLVGATKGDWIEALLFALSVAVGLTPEMLSMIVTVNLAKGALVMAKKKVIVKRLPAIQNLGAVTLLCTDKTGTLTQDRVVLERHVDITGHKSEEVLNYAYLNSYFQTGLRNLLDRAVVEHADLDVSECRLVDELPFDFQRRRMSVIVEYEDDNVLICKGAVEEIYSCCSQYQIDEEIYPLIGMIRSDLLQEVERLNREGFRALGIAYREFPRTKTSFSPEDESQLVLLGYIAFLDPPKESAMEALRLLARAGVRVKVLTGDNEIVTTKVCRDVGIDPKIVVSGSEIEHMSPDKLARSAKEGDVFVKLNPSQKELVIKTLRGLGEVVGYMGDGINDAPALKASDVGISVDSAVDVAKEAADIVLLEKSLLVVEAGIMEGRRIFCNIIKYLRMGASSNFGNMFSVLGASYLLPFLPMKPIQILANNLLYDLSQTGIPMDDVDPELVAKPIAWDVRNIRRFMMYIGPISSIFDYATFTLMWFFFRASSYLDPALGAQGKAAVVSLFQTGWFVESLLTQTLIVHIIRTRRIPFIQSRASFAMTATTLLVMAAGAWLPYSPLAPALGLAPLPPIYWAWIALFLLCYSVLTHKVKTWFMHRFEGA
jgi:Mg2+-importing ATPase